MRETASCSFVYKYAFKVDFFSSNKSLFRSSVPAECHRSIPVWCGPWPTRCVHSQPVCPPAAPDLGSVWCQTGPEETAYSHWSSCSWKKQKKTPHILALSYWSRKEFIDPDRFTNIHSVIKVLMTVHTVTFNLTHVAFSIDHKMGLHTLWINISFNWWLKSLFSLSCLFHLPSPVYYWHTVHLH